MFTFEMFFAQFGKYATIVNGYSPKDYHTVSNVRYPRNPSIVLFSDNSGHFQEQRFSIVNRRYEEMQFGHFQNWKEAYDQITERMPIAKQEVESDNMLE
jgi:hypothetical protein